MELLLTVWVSNNSVRWDVFSMMRAICFDTSMLLCLCLWGHSLLLKVDQECDFLLLLLPALLFRLLQLSKPKRWFFFFSLDFIYHFLANNTFPKIVYSSRSKRFESIKTQSLASLTSALSYSSRHQSKWCSSCVCPMAFVPFWWMVEVLPTQWHVCCWKGTCLLRCSVPQDLSLCSGTCTSEAIDLGLCLLQWRKDGMVKVVGRLRR